MEITQKICLSILIIGIIVIFTIVVNRGIIKHEQIECQEWLWQSETYCGFYWTEWQIEQCVAANMYPIEE